VPGSGWPAPIACHGGRQRRRLHALHGDPGKTGGYRHCSRPRRNPPYTGSGHSAVRLPDGGRQQNAASAGGIRTPDWLIASPSTDQVNDALGFPVVGNRR
jgi:hypothetical protein